MVAAQLKTVEISVTSTVNVVEAPSLEAVVLSNCLRWWKW